MKKTIPLALLVAVLGLSLALVLSLTGGSGGGDPVPDPLSAVQDGVPVGPEGPEPLAKAVFDQPAGIAVAYPLISPPVHKWQPCLWVLH